MYIFKFFSTLVKQGFDPCGFNLFFVHTLKHSHTPQPFLDIMLHRSYWNRQLHNVLMVNG